MLTLYHMQESGNCYKLRLAMNQLGEPFDLVDIDIMKGESRTPDFLARINANGRVPVLRLADGRLLPESNAALCYLADGTPLLPDDRFERADTLRWMFFEQYSHEPYIAVARFWRVFAPCGGASKADRFPEWMERGRDALSVMERHLAERPWLAAGRYTVADIALYAYTHVADEGGFDLAPYPAVRAWLARVAAQPGHVPMSWRPS